MFLCYKFPHCKYSHTNYISDISAAQKETTRKPNRERPFREDVWAPGASEALLLTMGKST